ncbi:hypothetical protein O3M35_005309 [Rhynocoris fuscipes]|uniref:ATP synthase F0 subunit 8 n=1 Tax=Rhynocoris fuscipes TaxID=488301 RepID=A0AAW1DN72_9HEMI
MKWKRNSATLNENIYYVIESSYIPEILLIFTITFIIKYFLYLIANATYRQRCELELKREQEEVKKPIVIKKRVKKIKKH